MNATENLHLAGMQLAIDRLAVEIATQRKEAAARSYYDGLPEWLDLEQCVSLKRGICMGKKRSANGTTRGADELAMGGAAMNSYRQKPFLQPCGGLHYKLIVGRKCWKKKDVIAWLGVTDEDLYEYVGKFSVRLPETYEKRRS